MSRSVAVVAYSDIEVETGGMTVNVTVEGSEIELYADEALRLVEAIEASLAELGEAREPKVQTTVINEAGPSEEALREVVLKTIAEVAYDAWLSTEDPGQEATFRKLQSAAAHA